MLNEPFTEMLNTCTHSWDVPFSRIESERLPSIATGDAPVVRAEPFNHMLSFMRRTLLFANGPSNVAVTFGASRTSMTIEAVEGRKWN